MLHYSTLVRWLVCAVLASTACSDRETPTVPPPPALGAVTISPGDTTILAGRPVQLAVSVRSVEGRLLAPAEYQVSFGVTPANAATVSSSGLVQPLLLGTITITGVVRAGDETRTAQAVLRVGTSIGRR